MEAIVALDCKNGIGKNGVMPWHIKEDLMFFKTMTNNNVVIMGKNTFTSLNNNPLKDRLNIVITSDKKFPKFNNLISFGNLDDAFNYCKMNNKINKVFVIGGKSIYDTCLHNEKYSNNIDKIYLSIIYNSYESNVFINLKHILKNYCVIDFNNGLPSFLASSENINIIINNITLFIVIILNPLQVTDNNSSLFNMQNNTTSINIKLIYDNDIWYTVIYNKNEEITRNNININSLVNIIVFKTITNTYTLYSIPAINNVGVTGIIVRPIENITIKIVLRRFLKLVLD
jgi:dihydrofolate reductase